MLNVRKTTWGGLSCRVVEAAGRSGELRAAVILCHGFGAPGTDLVPLSHELAELIGPAADHICFVFPEAPIDLAPLGLPGGRAWWPLDMERMQAAINSGEFRNLRNESPPRLPDARQRLLEVVAAVRAETKLPSSRLVLGGFSQGAMLATDVALRMPEPPGGLVVWSGTLLCEAEWRPLAEARATFEVVQSHGEQDPLLPFEAAGWLRDLLSAGGRRVRFLPFRGFHQIPPEAIRAAAGLIGRVAGAE